MYIVNSHYYNLLTGKQGVSTRSKVDCAEGLYHPVLVVHSPLTYMQAF